MVIFRFYFWMLCKNFLLVIAESHSIYSLS